MKLTIRLLSFVIACALLLSACSCGKSTETVTDTGVITESTAETVPFNTETDVSQSEENITTAAQADADSDTNKDNNTEV